MTFTTDILREGHNCYRIASCRRMAFLIDGENYFKALAETLKNARQAVYILGWDFDSRIHLLRDKKNPDSKYSLNAFLNSLLHQRPDLHIYVLDWDFPMIYAFEREPLPVFRIAMKSHPRLHFEMDSRHPFGASQHQKLVVIDDQLAFCGGIDLTNSRWDTQEHRPEEPRRIDNGQPYSPFHDVQIMVEGEVAANLADLARERWRKATGESLARPSAPPDSSWPPSFAPDLEHAHLGVARTTPEQNGKKGAHEIENLYLDAIRSAQRLIYIENQYFTANKVGQALARRLQEKDGPEIILIVPKHCSGWLEESTMGVLRARLVKQLRESDRWNRLSIFYPSRRDDDDEFINVHAKVMIIDNVLLRIGSSNLNNRSMGLDSECDLALEGKNEERINKEIARFRSRLLAEHCGVSVQQVEDALAGHESAAAAIRTLSANTRHLEPLEIEVDDLIEDIVPDADLLDPERPISLEKFIHQFSPGLWEQRDGKRKISKNIPLSSNAVKITAISMLLAVLLVLWKWTPLGEWLDANTLAGWGSMVREMPAAPLIVVSTYIVAGLFVFPITVLILATVLAFGPVSGFLYALSGSLVNAAAIYFLGRILGRGTMRKLLGKRLTDLSRRLARQGLLTVVAVRILPVAPFSVINMVAGASHIKFRDFFWGTLIGLFPGILALTAAGKGLGELLFSQKRGSFLSTALLFAAAVVGILFLHLVLKKKTGEKPGSEAGGDE